MLSCNHKFPLEIIVFSIEFSHKTVGKHTFDQKIQTINKATYFILIMCVVCKYLVYVYKICNIIGSQGIIFYQSSFTSKKLNMFGERFFIRNQPAKCPFSLLILAIHGKIIQKKVKYFWKLNFKNSNHKKTHTKHLKYIFVNENKKKLSFKENIL